MECFTTPSITAGNSTLAAESLSLYRTCPKWKVLHGHRSSRRFERKLTINRQTLGRSDLGNRRSGPKPCVKRKVLTSLVLVCTFRWRRHAKPFYVGTSILGRFNFLPTHTSASGVALTLHNTKVQFSILTSQLTGKNLT